MKKILLAFLVAISTMVAFASDQELPPQENDWWIVIYPNRSAPSAYHFVGGTTNIGCTADCVFELMSTTHEHDYDPSGNYTGTTITDTYEVCEDADQSGDCTVCGGPENVCVRENTTLFNQTGPVYIWGNNVRMHNAVHSTYGVNHVHNRPNNSGPGGGTHLN